MNEVSTLINKTTFPSCEVIAKRKLSLDQEAGPHQILNLLEP